MCQFELFRTPSGDYHLTNLRPITGSSRVASFKSVVDGIRGAQNSAIYDKKKLHIELTVDIQQSF